MARTALHVSPHPDDESIGAPCTLLALKDAGWRVLNLVSSLGREHDWERRRAEVQAATEHVGIENHIHDGPIRLSAGDDLWRAQDEVVAWLRYWFIETRAELIIGPHPQDGHHGHEAVARGIHASVRAAPHPVVWWMWGIWQELPQPTMLVPCDAGLLGRSTGMLEVYRGELARNNYLDMHRARRQVNAIRGPEQVFGFGSAQLADVLSAELLTEVRWMDDAWRLGRPRRLEMDDPEPTTDWGDPAGPWLSEASWRQPVARRQVTAGRS